jgi:GT2 family glycosyltransferase
MARREALDAADWFDEQYFMYAEDVDLSRTLISLGWKLYYCAEAETFHVCGGTSSKAPSGFAVLMKNESIAKYIRKYHGCFGEIPFRGAVFLAAGIRFAVTALVRVFSRSALAPSRKEQLTMLWALGFKRAQVANTIASTTAI